MLFHQFLVTLCVAGSSLAFDWNQPLLKQAGVSVSKAEDPQKRFIIEFDAVSSVWNLGQMKRLISSSQRTSTQLSLRLLQIQAEKS